MMLVIVSGRSGSGKSVALHALEDMGFYCVDNLPISMLPELAHIVLPQQRPVAISLDIRNFPKEKLQFDTALLTIPKTFTTHLVYLESSNETLIRRYNESRRRHPLSSQQLSLEESIEAESSLLKPLRERADLVINTSNMSIHELSAILQARLLGKQEKQLLITVESFGFKYGLPSSADYVFDVRFLNNPHWIPELKNLTGLDQPVKDFLSQHTEVHHFIYQTSYYLEQWLPMLESNNRNYLTVAIGCTGGKHRSVYVAEKIAEHFKCLQKQVNTLHRNINS